jgi:hypothetical protein
MGENKYYYSTLIPKSVGNKPLKDRGDNKGILLKWILKKLHKFTSAFIWLRTETNVEQS